MNPLEPYKPSTSTVSVLLAVILSVLATGCTDDPPTAPSTASGPPPIAVTWEKLPYKMLVTQREYIGSKGWSEKPDGRIGKIWLLDPLTRTCSVVLQSDIYEFRDLRVDHATSNWYFVSDRFSYGGWPKVLKTSAQGGFFQVSYTPEGEPKELSISPSGRSAFYFQEPTGWGPQTTSKTGVWIESDLFLQYRSQGYRHPVWADEQHLFVTATQGINQVVYRVSVKDTTRSLAIDRNSIPLFAKGNASALVESPEVSPAGDCLAFQANYTDRTSVSVRSLWTIQGQDTTEVLHEAYSGAGYWESRISPDGKYIAVGREGIWILRTDGSESSCVITDGWICSFDWL